MKTRSDGADVAVIPRSYEQQPSDKGNDVRFSSTLKQVTPSIFVWGPHKLLQGLDILRNVIVSVYATFYQIKVFVKIFFIIDKTSSRAGFGPRAVVWRPLP